MNSRVINHHWNVHDTFEEASIAAADFLAEKIILSIENHDICRIILPGGNSPAQCLKYLSEKKLPWSKVNWYLGDERCYPSGHADRNDVMLQKNLWSRLSRPNIALIPAEFGPEEGAKQYRKIIETIKYFDIAFLGIGEDGHTASLFPDNEALNDNRSVVPVYHSPKAPDDRVSLSVNTLSTAKIRVVLTGGNKKSNVLLKIKKGSDLPINRLGEITWFVDEDAV